MGGLLFRLVFSSVYGGQCLQISVLPGSRDRSTGRGPYNGLEGGGVQTPPMSAPSTFAQASSDLAFSGLTDPP
jgi:hypothetical protein